MFHDHLVASDEDVVNDVLMGVLKADALIAVQNDEISEGAMRGVQKDTCSPPGAVRKGHGGEPDVLCGNDHYAVAVISVNNGGVFVFSLYGQCFGHGNEFGVDSCVDVDGVAVASVVDRCLDAGVVPWSAAADVPDGSFVMVGKCWCAQSFR